MTTHSSSTHSILGGDVRGVFESENEDLRARLLALKLILVGLAERREWAAFDVGTLWSFLEKALRDYEDVPWSTFKASGSVDARVAESVTFYSLALLHTFRRCVEMGDVDVETEVAVALLCIRRLIGSGKIPRSERIENWLSEAEEDLGHLREVRRISENLCDVGSADLTAAMLGNLIQDGRRLSEQGPIVVRLH
jgi:hypothetical protein